MLLSILVLICKSEDEVNDHSYQDNKSQERRTKFIVETSLSPLSNRLRSPVKCTQRIDHCEHRRKREEEGRDEGRLVTKVQHANGKSCDDYTQAQP